MLFHPVSSSLQWGVIKEGSEERRICVMSQLDQEAQVEFKVARELKEELVNAVQPLQEDGTTLVEVGRSHGVTASVSHLVAKVEPFPFNKNLKSLDGSVVRIEKQFCEGDYLWGPVPTVTAVNKDWPTFYLKGCCTAKGGL